MTQKILVWHPEETGCKNTSLPEDQAGPKTRIGMRMDRGRIRKTLIAQEREGSEVSALKPYSIVPYVPEAAGVFYLLSVLDDTETRFWYLYWASFSVCFKVQELIFINAMGNVFLTITESELIVHVCDAWSRPLFNWEMFSFFLLLSFQGTSGQDNGVSVVSSVPKAASHKS